MNYTQILGEYAANLTFDKLPKEVVEQVKLITLHTIAVSVASRDTTTTSGARELAEAKGGSAEATIWGGSRKKVPADEAAYVNGTAADALDWEDCTWTGHASAGAIPAGFAMAEKLGASGRQYIGAIAAAYEAYQRIAMSVQPELENQIKNTGKGRGWGLVNYNIFAAGIAAGKLRGFDPALMSKCITVNAYLVPMCIGKTGGTDLYHAGHGAVAKSGVINSYITTSKLEDVYDGLDGPNGYWRQISDQVDWSWCDRDLGKDWLIMETLLKHWPANVWLQGPLECLHNIYVRRPFTADDVEKIEITPKIDIINQSRHRPMLITQSQYSIPHCFAAYLENPEPSAVWFTADRRGPDSPFVALDPKVLVGGEEINRYVAFRTFMARTFPETTAAITLKNGEVLTEKVLYPKGHPRNQFTLDEECSFFLKRTTEFLGEEKAQRFVEAIRNLENCENIAGLGQYLTVD